MFKATAKITSGQLLIFGFSEMNFVKLKEGKPIVVEHKDLKLPWPGGIILSAEDADVGNGDWSILVITDEMMRHMRNGMPLLCLNVLYEIVVFWGKDDDTLQEMMAPLIGPLTENLSPTIPAGQHRHQINLVEVLDKLSQNKEKS